MSDLSKPQHSPTPWSVGYDYGITGPRAARMLDWEDKLPICYEGKLGGYAARLPVCALPESCEGAREDAAFIVRAVNAHEALCNLLEGALIFMRAQPEMYQPDQDWTAAARAALALAKGDGE